MAFIIDGTTGIATVDGSVSAPSQRGQDNNTGISYAADTIKFSTNGVERMAITNSGVSGVSGGKILQVVQSVKSDTASWSGTSFTDIAGTDETGAGSIWEVNITPTAANSKILVEFSAAMGSTQGVMMTVRLVREINDANPAYPALGDAGGVRPRITRQVRDDQTAMKTHAMHQSHFSFLDTPSYSLGNKITYHLEGIAYDAGETVYINRSGSQENLSTRDGNGISTLTAQEVAA
tara:strand:+ start:117 stop:821 length:705 start_codon:yes stop_codon:yes gene_type:complete